MRKKPVPLPLAPAPPPNSLIKLSRKKLVFSWRRGVGLGKGRGGLLYH